MPAVVRRLEEHRLPELVVAAVAGDPDVSHAAAPGRFPWPVRKCRAASSPAPCPATAGDRTGSTAACSRTEKRTPKRSCPDQRLCANDHRGRIRTWSRQRRLGAVIRTGRADRGGGGQGKHRMGLGHGGPDARSGLAVSLIEQSVRLSGKFPGRGGNALVRSSMLPSSRRPCSGSDTTHAPP